VIRRRGRSGHVGASCELRDARAHAAPYEAARRELTEETGLDPTAIVDQPVVVQRGTRWNGRRFIGPEPFFVARFDQHEPPLSRLGLLADEHQNLRGHGWRYRGGLAALDGRLEPPTLARIVARFEASRSV
jgi:8-oxo-dGTP pyrophosphatase MutT (NUDIX family)